jgi:hypothetical protein
VNLVVAEVWINATRRGPRIAASHISHRELGLPPMPVEAPARD